MREDKYRYNLPIRDKAKADFSRVSNSLNDCLFSKHSDFWKTWHAEFLKNKS